MTEETNWSGCPKRCPKSLGCAPATIEVTLISRTNHHLFQPLLYDVGKRVDRSYPYLMLFSGVTACGSYHFGFCAMPSTMTGIAKRPINVLTVSVR